MFEKKGKFLKQKTIVIASLLIFGAILPAQTRNVFEKSAPAPKSKTVNAAQLLRDVETLAADEMRGRAAGTEGGAKAREYVLQKFKAVGLQTLGDSFLQEFPVKLRGQSTDAKGFNVIGAIKGKKQPEKYIVITAHYDHVGVQKGEIYNGADDNASGTAALFALAEYFNKKRPAHSLVFVALDAEEIVLQGARHFVANLPVKKEAILLNINMDMISRSEKGELYAAGAFHYPHLKPHLERVAKKAPVKLKLGHDSPDLGNDDWTNQSDHAAFHQAKIPFIYFGVEDHKDYHRPTDDFDRINQEFYVRAVETILDVVKTLDKNLK
jgi:Zn-dependent M28 family amino/carboxypeptidase